MPLNAFGWTTEEDEKLAEHVKPHTYLYNLQDPSRKNILARESTWQEIAEALGKPVEECKKRWRGLRDGYMRSKRVGAIHRSKEGVFEKLQFLEGTSLDGLEDTTELKTMNVSRENLHEETILETEQVITDNQEYYEITVVDGPQETETKPIIKILPRVDTSQDEPPKKTLRKNVGRKKSIPLPRNFTPVKILPKPIVMNGPKIVRYIEDAKVPENKSQSQTMDKLIEKMLKENTNEIDVFFRSMAASVKKLQPNLIPKVKMEVCNVIAKYEMQSYERNMQ